MDNNNATEKCNTNLESSEPGLYLKLLEPTLESKKRLRVWLLRILSANTVYMDINGIRFERKKIKMGVFQGSVAGPLLSSIFQ